MRQRHPVLVLPRSRRDFFLQVTIWLGFVLAYEAARGLAAGGAEEAFRNARRLIRAEQGLHAFFEPSLQERALGAGQAFIDAANWTYWLSQFVVVSLVLVWIYFRRYGSFLLVRDTIIVANLLGLIGYVAFPVAPPRLLPHEGFVDTLAASSGLSHGSAIVRLVSNQYAAMPSLHAADALIVGVALVALVGRTWLRAVWALWPVWVSFALLVTANHFWLDLAVAALVAAVGAWIAQQPIATLRARWSTRSR